MKTVVTSIITSVVTVIVTLLIVYTVWGDCPNKEGEIRGCKEYVKSDCGSKVASKMPDCKMDMEKLQSARTDFNTELSEEEISSINTIREKFGNVDHEKLCPEGMEKFREEHSGDIAVLTAIAENHKESLEKIYAGVHKSTPCPGETKTAEAVKDSGCPEMAACKEATEKCKGSAEKPVSEKKCEEAKAKCEKDIEKCKAECRNTFYIHFLLLDGEE